MHCIAGELKASGVCVCVCAQACFMGWEENEIAELGFTQGTGAAVDMVQAGRLMRPFINIMFRAMMDSPRPPAGIFLGKGH